MSTRSCIAERKGDHWEGVYHHSDGYPTWLGKMIWGSVQGKFKGDIQKFIDFTIHKHDGGWSIFPETCYCHGHFAKRDGTKPGQGKGIIKGCECNTKPYKSSNKDEENPCCNPLFIEWVYVLDPQYKKMAVLYHESKAVGKEYTYRHQLATVIDFRQEEPDWKLVECGNVYSI